MSRRAQQIERLGNDTFDVVILGGGITGVAAAHVLTRRGYRVALADNHDFSSGTSQESSQLIWGGIKYLENGHVGLVRDLCHDRNALVRECPGRVQPMPFLYPHYSHDAHGLPALLAGAWLYWTLGRGFGGLPTLKSTGGVRALAPEFTGGGFRGGFTYFDARMVDSDARLTLDFLFDAMGAGLTAVNYAGMRSSRWNAAQGVHELEFDDAVAGRAFTLRARWIVNAAGCWADPVNDQLGIDPPYRHLFSKGIHIVIRRLETHAHALTCLAADRRPFFVIPWGAVTLIGTTDTPFEEPPRRVHADAGDIDYLKRECEAKFGMQLDDADIISTKAGLRPLLKPDKMHSGDFLALARSHKVWGGDKERVTSVWGGKYTSCFSMAEEIAATIKIAPSESARPGIDLHPAAGRPADSWVENGEPGIEAISAAMDAEMVVKMEDFLRRRTNIALKVGARELAAGGMHAAGMDRFQAGLERIT